MGSHDDSRTVQHRSSQLLPARLLEVGRFSNSKPGGFIWVLSGQSPGGNAFWRAWNRRWSRFGFQMLSKYCGLLDRAKTEVTAVLL